MTADQLAAASGAHDKIAEDIHPLGGFLRCTVCGSEQGLGSEMRVASYLRIGWPRCCGYTMRWWTQRQIDAGEVTRAS